VGKTEKQEVNEIHVILVIGEILFDEFPDYKRLGGAPFNFAFHLKNFGFEVRFISRIGRDAAGKEILERLEACRFDLGDIQRDDLHPTGSVTVRLDKKGSPRFDIVEDVAYDYVEFIPESHSGLVREAGLIYFGSLAQRSEAGHENLQTFISRKSPEALNFYDINLRPGCYDETVIKSSLRKTDILKLSAEEMENLRVLLDYGENGQNFIRHLLEAYSLDTISLTKGEMGSELFTAKGHFSAESAAGIEVVDTVGAGDAYAAMFAAGILKDWPPEEILKRATMFSSGICEIQGAIPDSASFYAPFKPFFR
jgi:fructokinase